jgi:hypothetical protein
VDDEARVERPAAVRLGLDLGQLLLGHAGIVLEVSASTRSVPPISRTSPIKLATPPMRGLPRQLFQLGADIEILALHADHRRSPSGHRREDRDLVAVAYLDARARHNPG